MRKKTIVFLDQYPGLSGGQKVLLNIALKFSKNGYSCIAILPSKGLLSTALGNSGIETIVFPMGYYNITRKNIFDFFNYALRLPILILLLMRLIKNNGVDIVYANGARTFIWATIACGLKKTPLFWHVHSIFKDPGTIRPLLFFAKANAVKKIFAVSRAAAEPFRDLGPKIEILFNAVKIQDKTAKGDILKNEHPELKDCFLVGTVGILEEWKNQEDLISAAKYIEDSGIKNIGFFIIGDSLYADPSKQRYKNKLKELTRLSGIENKIIFTGQRNDIRDVMLSLDILVISSKDPDPCPLVSLEAASLGTPVIATHFGGTKEIFKEGSEALFYKPGDHKSLAEKIIFLVKNPRESGLITQAARLKIITCHDLDIYLDKLSNIVETTAHGN